MPLGVTTTKDYWNFSVAVPKGGTCRLLLYRAGEMRPCISYDMEAVLGEIHAITLTGLDGTDYEYNYEIDGEVKVDPYVRRLTGRCVWGKPEKQDAHEVRGILETETYDWETTNCRRMPIVMWLLIIFMSEDLRKIRILRFLQKEPLREL